MSGLLLALVTSTVTSTLTSTPVVERSPLTFELSGYVQLDSVLWDQSSLDELDPSTRAPLNEERFLVRRARLRGEAKYHFASAVLEIDGNTLNGPEARLIAASLSLATPKLTDDEDRVPLVSGTLGLFKIPFGVEVQDLFQDRLFVEASIASVALFPGFYDLGAKVQGGWRFLRYQLAIMNGDPVGESGFGGRDPTSAKDILGRLGISTRAGVVKVEAGVSGLTGKSLHRGTPSTKDVIVWRDTNENGLIEDAELQAIGGTAGTPSQTFRHQALGADLRLRLDVPSLGALTVFGELFFAKNLDRGFFPADPVSASRDVRQRGFVVGFTQMIRDWAMLGIRFDLYDPDADAVDQQGAQLVPRDTNLSRFAVVAAWVPVTRARIALEYDHNTNALGRGVNGVPTRLADDALILRGQMVF